VPGSSAYRATDRDAYRQATGGIGKNFSAQRAAPLLIHTGGNILRNRFVEMKLQFIVQ
jgi:hypothetical protein